MTSTSSTLISSFTNKDDECLEIFSIIWLDENINTKANEYTRQKLRSIINNVKTFADHEECRKYIERRPRFDRLVLIVSEQFGRHFIPSVHELRQISTVYLTFINKIDDGQWTKEFIKVKIIADEPEKLIAQVKSDHTKQMKVNEPLSINMSSKVGNIGRSTTGINGRFAYSQLLIDCLLRLKSTETDRKELISCLKTEYSGNHVELGKLDEFQNDYKPDKALWWYSRESFFYKTLNAALRKQNIHIIFLYRTFIVHMLRQLHHYQCQNSVRVYRSQLMSMEEIDELKQNIGELVSINSFLSTSKQRQVAIFYMGDICEQINLQRVLFEIEARPDVVSKRPFADICTISHFTEESEVLFMLGSIFQLKSITHGDDNLWTISMSLCDDKEHDLKKVLADMKKQYRMQETNLRTLGKLLWKMGQPCLAEQYYNRFIEELATNDPSLVSIYADLADMASQQCDYDKSVRWHQKCFEAKGRNSESTGIKTEQPQDLLEISYTDLKLEEEIGCGAFGTVYRALWLSRHEIVAIKQLNFLQLDEHAEKEFYKELRLMHSVRYPHIVTFYGACMEKKNYALVMEYMSLGSLYKVLHKDKIPLDWSDRLFIALQAAKGINYLHQLQQPILHRDIKSLNFLLAKSFIGYIVKVCDFGLAQTRSESTRQSFLYNGLACTLQWTAPEILNLKAHTEKSDVYSLGTVYWELVTNKIPYDGHQNAVICEFVLRGNRLEIPDAIPFQFSTIIEDCWAQNPYDRPSCSDLIKVIEACIQQQNALATTSFEKIKEKEDTRSTEFQINASVLSINTTGEIKTNTTMDEVLGMENRNSTIRIAPKIPFDAKWTQDGVTVVGGHGSGNATNQLCWPKGLIVYDDETMIIADCYNHRIIQWKFGETDGQIVAGGNGKGNRLDQLNEPTNALIDKETDSLIICDRGNRRVVRWSRRNGTSQGEILIDKFACYGLAMDEQRFLYISDVEKHEVRRYRMASKSGVLVAGGNGTGDGLHQLSLPKYLVVDKQQNVYVSDWWNHRVMKWSKGSKEGIVVAGGQGKGTALTHVSYPQGIFVDTMGTVYVGDEKNYRVVRWVQGAKQGSVIVGGNGYGDAANQFNYTTGLCFDRHGNLYVADNENHRVQRFSLE